MTTPSRRPIAGNTNTALLKLIALIFMFIDHAGKMCFPGVTEMRLLGRIAFPLYCWCMVVGACHTHSFPKYLMRIGLIGLISQPLYMVALDHSLGDINIFLTLFLALTGLWGIRAKKWGSHLWAPVLALVLAVLLDADYGWKGVLLVFLLYAVRDSRRGLAAVMAAFCLYWGTSSSVVTSVCGLSLMSLTRGRLAPLFSPMLRLQGMAILALPFMLIPMHWTPRLPRWTGYVLYPAHLILLILLEAAMGVDIHWEQITEIFQQLIALL